MFEAMLQGEMDFHLGFESNDHVIEMANEWQSHFLNKFYTFLFVNYLYVSTRKEMETKSCAMYVIWGYNLNGVKDILGVLIGESEGKHYWMQRCIIYSIHNSVKHIPSQDYKAYTAQFKKVYGAAQIREL